MWRAFRCAVPQASVAIAGSKFKAVNNRDKNFTRAKMDRRVAQVEESIARYLHQLDTADRQEPSEALKTKTSRLKPDRRPAEVDRHGYSRPAAIWPVDIPEGRPRIDRQPRWQERICCLDPGFDGQGGWRDTNG